MCGSERWTIKTLQDRPRLIRAKPSTVANLTGLPRPTPFPTTRLPTERHIYSVVASVTLVRSEADQDLHLVLQDGPAHMIAESPTVPACTAKATAYRRKQMADARKVVRVCPKARVVGGTRSERLIGLPWVEMNLWLELPGSAPKAIAPPPLRKMISTHPRLSREPALSRPTLRSMRRPLSKRAPGSSADTGRSAS
jgi:hypothetical protein